jgi:hypothetical protein
MVHELIRLEVPGYSRNKNATRNGLPAAGRIARRGAYLVLDLPEGSLNCQSPFAPLQKV